jgi:hypothetical protein
MVHSDYHGGPAVGHELVGRDTTEPTKHYDYEKLLAIDLIWLGRRLRILSQDGAYMFRGGVLERLYDGWIPYQIVGNVGNVGGSRLFWKWRQDI